MSAQLWQVSFVVWRESVEALLIIGILNAWLAHQGVQAARGRLFLWTGVGAGLLVACVLGGALIAFSDFVSEEGEAYFQTGMVLIAAALILQMVVWMRRHGRALKRELEDGAARAMAQANWWMLFVLALVAASREGSETAVFLYAIFAAATELATLAAVAAAVGGFAAALATYGLLQAGRRFMSWRAFFRVTEIMLLLLAAALLLRAADHLVSLDLLPMLSGPLWDTSSILDDGGIAGGILSGLTGYRAKPDLTSLIVYGVYWAAVIWALPRLSGTRRAQA